VSKRIWISKEVYELAEELAKKRGKTVEEFVLEAVQEKIGESGEK